MTISLISAFRERTKLLQGLIDSIIDNTEDLEQIELLLALDNDDGVGIEYVKDLADEYSWIKYDLFDRSEHFVRDYINPLAGAARGKYVIVVNDDLVIRTHHWDRRIINKMDQAAERYGDPYQLGMLDDDLPGRPWCCWPVVSKKSIDDMGYLFYEGYKIWGSDYLIHLVYKYNDRLVDISEVYFEHISVHTGKRDFSENHERFSKVKDAERVESQQINTEAARLRDLIARAHG